MTEERIYERAPDGLVFREGTMTGEQIRRVVDIHIRTFPGFFLTFLGKGFLRQFYTGCAEYENAGILLAEKDGMPVGFIAYTDKPDGFYGHLLRRRLIPFAWYAAGAFFRNPKTLVRLLRAFLRPSESKRDEAYTEVMSVGVDPDFKRMHIASRLLSCAKARFDPEKVAYIGLETDAVNNEGANLFYQKNEFVLVREYATREGRKMNEYRWKP